jgi:hypothetical protein
LVGGDGRVCGREVAEKEKGRRKKEKGRAVGIG